MTKQRFFTALAAIAALAFAAGPGMAQNRAGTAVAAREITGVTLSVSLIDRKADRTHSVDLYLDGVSLSDDRSAHSRKTNSKKIRAGAPEVYVGGLTVSAMPVAWRSADEAGPATMVAQVNLTYSRLGTDGRDATGEKGASVAEVEVEEFSTAQSIALTKGVPLEFVAYATTTDHYTIRLLWH